MAKCIDIKITPEAAIVSDVGIGAIPDHHKDEVKKAVVSIHRKDAEGKHHRGSGFIAKLAIDGQNKVLLLTCHHVLPSLTAAQDSDIYFGRIIDDDDDDDNAGKYTGIIINGKVLFDGSFFMTDVEDVEGWGKKLDYTAVEVKVDVMQKKLRDEVPKPLSLAKAKIMEERKQGLCVNDLLHIVHYPKEHRYIRCSNSAMLCVLKGPYIGHMATTDSGSSGSPILREYDNKWVVVGLHRGTKADASADASINIATCMTAIADDVQGIPYTGEVPELGCFSKAAKRPPVERTHTPASYAEPTKKLPVHVNLAEPPKDPRTSDKPSKYNEPASSRRKSRILADEHCMQLRQPKTDKWKDDQMAVVESDLEWTATPNREAVKSEPAWNGAGQKVPAHKEVLSNPMDATISEHFTKEVEVKSQLEAVRRKSSVLADEHVSAHKGVFFNPMDATISEHFTKEVEVQSQLEAVRRKSSVLADEHVSAHKGVFFNPMDATISEHSTKEVEVKSQLESSSRRRPSKKHASELMVPCCQLEDPDHEGWLQKLSGRRPKNWRKRWFVLKGPKLYYYKTEFDGRPRGLVNLSGYTVEETTDSKKRFAFHMYKEGERTYYFIAVAPGKMTKWMQMLEKASEL